MEDKKENRALAYVAWMIEFFQCRTTPQQLFYDMPINDCRRGPPNLP
jgi:hypothetical protein